jgi:hypothetical protein
MTDTALTGWPALAQASHEEQSAYRSQGSWDLSVVVTIVAGGDRLVRCLDRLVNMPSTARVELLVPFDSMADLAPDLMAAFPSVRFLDLGTPRLNHDPASMAGQHELYDRRTAAGLKAARGEVVALIHDTCEPRADWADAILAAHRQGHSVVGGAIEHAGQGSRDWAVYFHDFARYQLPLRSGPAFAVSDANVSYRREVLHRVGPVWASRYKELQVNRALQQGGTTLWQCPEIVVHHRPIGAGLGRLLHERFAWGRLFGATRAAEFGQVRRLIYVVASPVIPALILGRIVRKAIRDRRNRLPLFRSFGILLLLTLAWTAGEFVGHATGRE